MAHLPLGTAVNVEEFSCAFAGRLLRRLCLT